VLRFANLVTRRIELNITKTTAPSTSLKPNATCLLNVSETSNSRKNTYASIPVPAAPSPILSSSNFTTATVPRKKPPSRTCFKMATLGQPFSERLPSAKSFAVTAIASKPQLISDGENPTKNTKTQLLAGSVHFVLGVLLNSLAPQRRTDLRRSNGYSAGSRPRPDALGVVMSNWCFCRSCSSLLHNTGKAAKLSRTIENYF
jgi:hypothetical protein